MRGRKELVLENSGDDQSNLRPRKCRDDDRRPASRHRRDGPHHSSVAMRAAVEQTDWHAQASAVLEKLLASPRAPSRGEPRRWSSSHRRAPSALRHAA